MKLFLALGSALLLAGCQNAQSAPAKDAPSDSKSSDSKPAKTMSLYDFKLKSLDGKEVNFADFKGKTLLIVNTASKCGYTKQYAGLQKLWSDYQSKGLVVIGVPANNFLWQEPGTDEEIATFCQKNFGVTFPMMSKLSVKGKDQAPLFQYLTQEANTDLKGDIGWNFEKFLVSPEGKLVSRFKSGVSPDSEELLKEIVANLPKK